MKHILRNTSEDQTREVRKVISENDTIEFEGKANTHGMLPEDLEKNYEPYGFIGDIGAGKILPIHGRENLTIKGGNFTNPDYAFPYDKKFDRRHHVTGELTFLDIYDSHYIDIIGTKFTGCHNIFYPDGKIKFTSKYEYDHALDISSSSHIYVEGFNSSKTPGDFVYIRKGDKGRSEYMSFVNCTVHSNARQGAAPADGKYIYFKNFRVKDSARGGDDNEPPKTGYDIIDQVIDGAWFTTRLLGVPMGGYGTVDGFYITDAIFETASPTMLLLADRVNSFRKNITFKGSRKLTGWGSSHGNYVLTGAQGVDLNNEHCYLKEGRGGVAVEVNYCENVVIRNCNFINGEYIVVRDTPLEEIKVYNNHNKMKFKVYEYDVPRIDSPDYLWHRETYGREGNQTWQAAMRDYEAYMNDRESRATFKIVDIEEYDYKKYGEDFGIRVPDFKPYLGKAGVEVEEVPWEDSPYITYTEEISFSETLEILKSQEDLIKYLHPFIVHEDINKIKMVIPFDDVLEDFINDPQLKVELTVGKIHYIFNLNVQGWDKGLIPDPEPVITTKEVVETEYISFNTTETNIESEAREGKKGVLSITYKLTFTDGVETNKEEVSREITTEPISKIVYVAPIELTPEPVPNPEPLQPKKEWYQNKGLWIIGGILIIILLLTIL